MATVAKDFSDAVHVGYRCTSFSTNRARHKISPANDNDLAYLIILVQVVDGSGASRMVVRSVCFDSWESKISHASGAE